MPNIGWNYCSYKIVLGIHFGGTYQIFTFAWGTSPLHPYPASAAVYDPLTRPGSWPSGDLITRKFLIVVLTNCQKFQTAFSCLIYSHTEWRQNIFNLSNLWSSAVIHFLIPPDLFLVRSETDPATSTWPGKFDLRPGSNSLCYLCQ